MNNPSRRTTSSMFIISPIVSSVQGWHVVRYKKFPKLTRTQKRRMQRQRAMDKRCLNETSKEAPKEETNKSLDPMEKATPNLKQTKFGRRATEDAKSIYSSDNKTYSRIIHLGTILISLNCSISSLTCQLSSSQRRWKKA